MSVLVNIKPAFLTLYASFRLLCGKKLTYMSIFSLEPNGHPTVIQVLFRLHSRSQAIHGLFFRKGNGLRPICKSGRPPKVPVGNLPLRTKCISAVRFAFLSSGPLIGQKNNPVAGRENGYIREIKNEIQSSTIKKQMSMEITSIQTVAERNIVSLALADIRPGNFNPRKHFDEESLSELADSIRQQGVLQAIGVRPVADTALFEIVFGERRYRASVMAGKTKIPAIILDVADDVAEEMAVTENLQRKDVTPMEEAVAYQKLLESGRYDVQSLAVQFGKSEDYIRTRLKFTTLIVEIAELLETDELSVSVASEICRYGEDIQREVYERHLTEGVYGSWRSLKASEVARNIERNFTTDLRHYQFDKTLCVSCPFNTHNMNLFHEEGCGNCAKRSCLEEKNVSFLVEKVVQVMEQQPTVTLCRDAYNGNDIAVERLVDMVENLQGYLPTYPNRPEEPQTDEYDTQEEYEQACKDYGQDMAAYNERCEEINRKADAGEIVLYARIERNDITLCYKRAEHNDGTDGQSLSPIEKLEKQDKRNKEIALEKTVEDTKKRILEADITETKFGADEDKMIYFFLLGDLRQIHYQTLGIEGEHLPYLSDKEKMDIVANLTAKAKAIIRRDFLIAKFKEARGGNAVASLLLDFAQKHIPETLADIKSGYDEVYEKRHQRIEEKKAVLLAKKTEQSEKPQQSGVQQQSEEVEA